MSVDRKATMKQYWARASSLKVVMEFAAKEHPIGRIATKVSETAEPYGNDYGGEMYKMKVLYRNKQH